MAEMLLINPRKRRRAAPKKRRAATTRRRRRNPVTVIAAAPTRRRVVRRRRSNPIGSVRRVMRRRRRNPIGLGSGGSIMNMLKAAAVGGAGAIAVDLAMGQIAKFLPVSMAKVPGKVGTYELAKIAVTIALGKFLSRPTRGLSQKMAAGSLTVQAHQLLSSVVPVGTMPLGYYSPAAIANASMRTGPNRVGRYTAPGQTPLLNGVSRYTAPGASPLLNGASQREGVRFR